MGNYDGEERQAFIDMKEQLVHEFDYDPQLVDELTFLDVEAELIFQLENS